MLILILIDIKYLQSVAFRFGKGSSGQNYSLSDSQLPINSPPSKISHSSLRLNIFEKSSMKKARVILWVAFPHSKSPPCQIWWP